MAEVPPGYLLYCLRVVCLLLGGGYVLWWIFLFARDAHKRKER